jgi:hypothetical protein
MLDDLKRELIKTLAKQAYAALLAIPGFGWVFGLPVVKQVFQYIVEQIITWATRETALGLSILWIELEMAYDIRSAEQAAKKLNDMINNPTKYSAAEQAKINELFDETTIDLVQLGLKRLV